MTRSELISQIRRKKTFLCVGLDTDLARIPAHLHNYKDPVFEFNRQIIDATRDYCIAYKANLAFYEAYGPSGLESLKKTIAYIPEKFFTIADAKRGDIGSTSAMYAKTYFEYYNFDAITISPYMGKDSVGPFLNYKNKWVILLALTSNEGAEDFQYLKNNKTGLSLYQEVIKKGDLWGSVDQMMFVVGATKSKYLAQIRKIIPDHFLLLPGIGAQGGNLGNVIKHGKNKDVGLLINSSRGIIYASSVKDFAEKASEEAKKIRDQMAIYLE